LGLGFNASIVVPVNQWVGGVADFGGFTKSEFGVTASVHTYGGGPQFTYRAHNIQPYARFVLGAANLSASAYGLSGSTTAFYIAPGGGADFRVTDHVWVRLGANYFRFEKYGIVVDGVQSTVGVTYRFGSTFRESYPAISNGKSTSVAPLLGALLDSKMQIIRFFPNSVLSDHGLELGDVINSVDGKDVHTSDELTAATASLTKGTVVKVGYLSHWQWQTWISVQL
jgi:hypothetical protein